MTYLPQSDFLLWHVGDGVCLCRFELLIRDTDCIWQAIDDMEYVHDNPIITPTTSAKYWARLHVLRKKYGVIDSMIRQFFLGIDYQDVAVELDDYIEQIVTVYTEFVRLTCRLTALVKENIIKQTEFSVSFHVR
ncbi:hypothetical protein SPFM1_00299 [Salmonella phage SPFM1]|nr:hypothetical protein SPFM1_00299 [Salmonella phage SPFM1]